MAVGSWLGKSTPATRLRDMAHAPQAWLMLKTYASSRMNSSGIEDPRHKVDVYGTDHGIKTRERAAVLAIETDKAITGAIDQRSDRVPPRRLNSAHGWARKLRLTP